MTRNPIIKIKKVHNFTNIIYVVRYIKAKSVKINRNKIAIYI